MKWFPFLILAVAATILQTTVARTIAIHSVSPDLMFILAAFYALWGPWPEAAIAAWLLGLVFDTQTSAPAPMGLYAFCYGAAAWGIIQLRQVFFRESAITQLLITFTFALLIQFAAGACSWWRSPASIPWAAVGWQALFTAIYTAALAPYLHWALARLHRWTGLKPKQRRAGYR